jgi:anti-sigma B factor antagonist
VSALDQDRCGPQHCAPASLFLCRLKVTGRSAAWVHAAGELDLASSPVLARILLEARLGARLTILDAREITFIDSSGVHAIFRASKACEREGGGLVLITGAAVERMLNIAGLADAMSTFEFSRAEPLSPVEPDQVPNGSVEGRLRLAAPRLKAQNDRDGRHDPAPPSPASTRPRSFHTPAEPHGRS